MATCVGRFKIDFAKLNKRIVGVFKRKYEQELKRNWQGFNSWEKRQTTPFRKTGQNGPNAASGQGAVITTAASTAKALMRRHPNLVGKIDLNKSEWAKNLFQWMTFTRRKATSSKLMVPAGAKKKGLSYYSIEQ